MNKDPWKQAELFDRMHDEYQRHMYDATAMQYREQFIYNWLLNGFDLNGKIVADLASGDGFNSLMLRKRFPTVETMGFDISSKACEGYEQIVGKSAYQIDLTTGVGNLAGFSKICDVGIVIGGLHHCISDLSATFRTISKLIKPGGYLLMCEPSSKFIFEAVRKFWYRHDTRYFEANTEGALNHDEISQLASKWFSVENCLYFGGPAFFLIYNSLAFRIPLKLKKYIAPPLFILEQLYSKLPGERPYPAFLARWRRR